MGWSLRPKATGHMSKVLAASTHNAVDHPQCWINQLDTGTIRN